MKTNRKLSQKVKSQMRLAFGMVVSNHKSNKKPIVICKQLLSLPYVCTFIVYGDTCVSMQNRVLIMLIQWMEKELHLQRKSDFLSI